MIRSEAVLHAVRECHWASGAAGPDAFDCWGLVRFIQREVFGRHLPVIDIDAQNTRAVAGALGAHPLRARFTRVEQPAAGDVVLMAHHRHPSHVGVWLDCHGGGVAHCARGAGVLWQKLSALQACGWSRIEFYRLRS